MKLLNSTTYEGKEYGLNDVRGFMPKETKGLPEGYYGGRVTQLAKTDVKGLYLCMENMQVIDILIFEDEVEDAKPDLSTLTNKELIQLLKEKGIETPNRATKDELLALFNEGGRIMSTKNMNFGEAIEKLKEGEKVAREGWNGKGMFIYLVEGTIVPFESLRRNAAKHITKEATGLDDACINSHIDMKTASGDIVVGWLASQTDMLAEDWYIVE